MQANSPSALSLFLALADLAAEQLDAALAVLRATPMPARPPAAAARMLEDDPNPEHNLKLDLEDCALALRFFAGLLGAAKPDAALVEQLRKLGPKPILNVPGHSPWGDAMARRQQPATAGLYWLGYVLLALRNFANESGSVPAQVALATLSSAESVIGSQLIGDHADDAGASMWLDMWLGVEDDHDDDDEDDDDDTPDTDDGDGPDGQATTPEDDEADEPVLIGAAPPIRWREWL